MPTGSFDINPVPAAIANQALPIYVCEYDPTSPGNPYTILPNVRCLRIDYREGPEPSVCRFQYLMDDLASVALGWPSQFEQLWPITAQGNYVTQTDDRLAVLTSDPSGNPLVLFDGFVQVPQVDISAKAQAVSFIALGAAVRLWDRPIRSRVQRNAAQATVTDTSADVPVNLPTRFNPSDSSVGTLGGYVGNAAAALSVDPVTGESYPVFIDENMIQASPSAVNYWIVWGALAYLLHTWKSPNDPGGNPYVVYPSLASLQALFAVAKPAANGVIAAGAATSNMPIRDYDGTNKAPPDVFNELVGYCGLVSVFGTNQTAAGLPQTTLSFQRRDELAAVAPKLIYLDANGATQLNLAANNTTTLRLARDCNGIVNQWAMESALQQVEVTVYLAPLFTPAAGDQDAGNVQKWYSTNLVNATDNSRRMYRWYGADECGDGHYQTGNDAFVTGIACNFAPVFTDPVLGPLKTVQRYRPGSKTLISKDASGKPLKAVLELCTSATLTDPYVQDRPDNLTWTEVTKGWKLLDDRFGIEVTVEDPENWHTGQQQGVGGKAAVPTIKGVSWQAARDGAKNQAIALRLTTVIESDHRILGATTFKSIASPTLFARERVADGKDHFQKCLIAPFSLYWATQKDVNGNPNNGRDPLVCRDDTPGAKTHTQQLQDAHQFPVLAGSVTIPFITDYYGIGDLIKIVSGRNASLQTNVGVNQGEAPTYPWITAFSWDFQGDRQRTELQFSDRRRRAPGSVAVNDLRVMRERQLIASAAADNAAGTQAAYGSAAMCVITATVETYPVLAGAFYACCPELITGPEVEGGAATFTADLNTVVYAYNIGTAVPPNGTKLIIHSAGGKWDFRYDG